jgi:hypothetical protein
MQRVSTNTNSHCRRPDFGLKSAAPKEGQEDHSESSLRTVGSSSPREFLGRDYDEYTRGAHDKVIGQNCKNDLDQ